MTDAREKRQAIEALLENGMVMLHLDARKPGVRVPSRFSGELQLRLNVSRRFSPPDLVVNDWGVRETLSFGGVPFPVSVPWEAIYAFSGPRGEVRLFPHSMPVELLEAIAETHGLDDEALRALREEAAATPVLSLTSTSEPEPPRPRFRPRLVTEPPAAAETRSGSEEPVVPDDLEPPPPSSGGGSPRARLRLVK